MQAVKFRIDKDLFFFLELKPEYTDRMETELLVTKLQQILKMFPENTDKMFLNAGIPKVTKKRQYRKELRTDTVLPEIKQKCGGYKPAYSDDEWLARYNEWKLAKGDIEKQKNVALKFGYNSIDSMNGSIGSFVKNKLPLILERKRQLRAKEINSEIAKIKEEEAEQKKNENIQMFFKKI